MLASFAIAFVLVAGGMWFLGASAMTAGDLLYDRAQPGMRAGGCR